MGAKEKFYSVESGGHGFDDVGFAQPTGSVEGATNAINEGPLFAGKLRLTLNTNVGLKKGRAIRIASLGNATGAHIGLTRVMKVIGATAVVVNMAFETAQTDGTGTWACDGGSGAWDAFMPLNGDISGGTNVDMTFFEPNQHGGSGIGATYAVNEKYYFPGGIRTVQVNTAGNIRLFRSASLRPRGV